MQKAKIIVVDDNHTFLEGLIYYLEEILGHQVTAYAESKAQFLEIKNVDEADIILMDIELSDGNGIEIVNSQYINTKASKYLAITNHYEKAYLRELIRSGFRGCVFKDELYNNLHLAIVSLLKGNLFFPTDILIQSH